ncbi:unnamed protein product (macronuclear) [Paramecium tetraurelia]|uniref:Uncharacterized protein n=1 Tax=Paramecium tetraurelia TaxID=5888 RepID=A0EI19_PARTE|nr:uncharacterized protein GSPATT00027287001 [Paramecium tetraurelia]CAK94960.1 unnamed protein product [Paramecium tetraurelia]|eukprot:XP_001462333.1 hypothetical protein (macronuclear) [Paramecium tetraurelia strain d4-2]
MHNFLFENRLSTYSTFSPFGSTKNSKPGIITKIKNKIQDLFLPSINPSSTIQRIQYYNELNLEKELSHQFKNKLAIVDHLLPKKEENITLKRKSLYTFDEQREEVVQNENQISKEAQSNSVNRKIDQSPQVNETKKQKKFKKNHAKIEKPRKMEADQQQRDYDFNKKSQNQNIESNQENSSGYISNYQTQNNDCFKDCIKSATPYKKQKGLTNEQMDKKNQVEIQSFKQDQKFDSQQMHDLKQQIQETQNGNSIVGVKQIIQENELFSSSTGTNTKGEIMESLLRIEHIFYSQKSDSEMLEEKRSNHSQLEIQNKLFSYFHSDLEERIDFDKKAELEQNRNPNDVKSTKSINQNQTVLETQQQQQQQVKKQRNLILDSVIINLQIQCSRQKQIDCKEEQQKVISQQSDQQKLNQVIQEDSIINHSYEKIQISNKQELKLQYNTIKQEEISQQTQVEKKVQHGQLQKQLDEKLETPLTQNQLSTINQEGTPKTPKITQEIDQQKQLDAKQDQMQKQNNPFLDTSSHISSDQVSQYFLQGFLTGNSQFPLQQQQCTRNQNFLDLFKVQTNNQLFNFNVPLQNQGYQTQNINNSQNIAQKNDSSLVYKQMEIIDQIPFSEQFNVTQQNNYHQTISNYFTPNFEQKYCQPATYQQSQSSNELISYQAPIQQQSLFPQMQQSSYQISSINLFQSNSPQPSTNMNCCQEEGCTFIISRYKYEVGLKQQIKHKFRFICY